MSTLLSIHRGLGYVVFVLLIAVAVVAFNRAKNGQEFEKGPFSIAMILLDIQVTLGIILYGIDTYWEAESVAIAYLHPIVMLAALAAGHIGLGRARREQMAADAYRTVGRFLGVATVLVILGIAAVSAA